MANQGLRQVRGPFVRTEHGHTVCSAAWGHMSAHQDPAELSLPSSEAMCNSAALCDLMRHRGCWCMSVQLAPSLLEDAMRVQPGLGLLLLLQG